MSPFSFFKRQEAQPPAADPRVPTPITQERLIEQFKAKNWTYFIDSDGDLGGQWDDAMFYFLLAGERQEILVVRSQYPGTIDASQLDTVRDVLEDSHRRRPFPKAWYRMDDDGDIRVMASNAIDCEYGATDEQLLLHLDSSIGMSVGLYERLNKALGR